MGFSGSLSAQDQPLVMEESANSPVRARPDPLRESALSRELQELARQPLPPTEGQMETAWRDTLAPVFSFIEDIPVNVVEQGAYKYRRARARLTHEARQQAKTPFRLMEDFKTSPELYWGRPVALHGYLTRLRRIPAEEGDDSFAWYEGKLKLWNDDGTVRFVARLLPDDLPAGDDLHEPVAVIGYLFSIASDSEKLPEPLIVARWVRWIKPELDLRTVADVKDRSIGILQEESDAFYRTLLHVKLLKESALKKQAEAFWSERQKQFKRPRPLFVDLFKTFEEDPHIYRGQAVTLTGTLRKLRELTVDPLNDYGIETLYEAWIFAEDSQSNPTVVVFAENSAELPEGDDLSLPVKVTGYVFKMYGYESRDKEHPLRVAPMLLAKTVKKMAITEPKPFPVAWVGAALALLCLGIVLFVWSSSRKDKEFREKTLKDENEEPPRFDHLTDQ